MEPAAKINEALELALAAIDKESIPQQEQQQQQLPQSQQQPENLYPITAPSSSSLTNTNLIHKDDEEDGDDEEEEAVEAEADNQSRVVEAVEQEEEQSEEQSEEKNLEILINKTDEEKCEKLKMEESFTTILEIKEKSEEDIAKEPIYENIISTTSMQQVDVASTTISTTSSVSVKHQSQQQQHQIIPSMIQNIEIDKSNQKQPKFNESIQNQIQNQNNINPIQKSLQNLSNQLKNSQINSFNCQNNNSNNIIINNNSNHNHNKVVELTNAFANTTITTTVNHKNNNNIISSNSCSSSDLTPQNTTLLNEKLTITNEQTPIISNSKSNAEEAVEQQQEVLNEEEITPDSLTEPYYQVPKSSEPYYDAPKHLKPIPVYENIEIYFNGSLNGELSSEINTALMQPPKEKPPPPPLDSPPLFDDVDSSCHTDTWSSSDNTYETLSRHQIQHHNNQQQQLQMQQQQHHHLTQDLPSPPIKRMNSTKRIKKELRNKRSSFLGIEGSSLDDDESYLELTVAPPPDMAQLLQEERRLEKQLYLKAGLCDSSDTGESRDSGVSENHSRQSSEHYTNSSEENELHDDTTSPLTLQTQTTLGTPASEMIYQNDGLLTVAPTPLLTTVKGNSAESWTESATVAAAATQSLTEATATANAKMMSIEEKIREQEEVLRVERELLQLEQEELKRQRENLMLRENMARRELQHGAKMLMSANRRSLQDLNGLGAMSVHNGNVNIGESIMPASNLEMYHQQQMQHAMQGQQQMQFQQQHQKQLPQQQPQQIYANIPNLQQQYYHMETDYRKSMSDINEFSKRVMSQPPPAPPSKPMRAMHVNTSSSSSASQNGMMSINSSAINVEHQPQQNDYMARQRHSLNSQSFGGSLVKIANAPTAAAAAPQAAPRGGAPHIYSNYHHQSVQNLSTSPNSQHPSANLSSKEQSLYPGNMSRNTLHALSATPKPKYTDGWVQVQQRKTYDSNLSSDPAWLSAYQQKRKSMPDTYQGYQQSNNHWLVQEAEQRRQSDQQQQLQQHQQQQRRMISSSNSTPVHQANKFVNGSAMHATTNGKPLPDSIIQTLTERVQSKGIGDRKRNNLDKSPLHAASTYHQHQHQQQQQQQYNKLNQQQQQQSSSVIHRHSTTTTANTSSSSNGQSNTTTTTTILTPQQQQQDKVLSVSGKKKCSHCGDELGRGAAMIIESLLLFYHINCFKCCVCHVQLGDGLNGTDVRVRNHKLHCQNCYSSDDGIKFSCV